MEVLDSGADLPFPDFEQRKHLDAPRGKETNMRKLLVLLLTGAVSVLAGTGAVAAGGADHFGPFPTSSADNGSCSLPWAMDTYDRSYTVVDNGSGTFKVTADSRGTFVTTGPGSPGACESTTHHGSAVAAGITGGFQGFLSGTVTSATYDPTGCSEANCSTTSGFIAAVFGTAAVFTCSLGFAGCDFNFEYHSSDQSLQYRHWQDKSDNHGGEQFVGDIANE
jgi:hypothetical protein